MKARERLMALVFDNFNLPDYQLGNIDEIMDINIFDDLGYDSIQFIELIVKIENEFCIEIDESTLFMENFSTIEKIVDLINEKFIINGAFGDE